jgi:hypothetical protein
MTRHIQLVSNKGGQGVTTTVALLAQGFAKSGLTVAVVDGDDGDLRAAMGLAHSDHFKASVNHKISWWRYGTKPDADVVIWDNCKPTVNTYETYVVVRNCYLSLRRNMDVACDGVILVREEDRALHPGDVASIFRSPIVLTIPVTTEISRRMDAGLFDRLPSRFTIGTLETTAK